MGKPYLGNLGQSQTHSLLLSIGRQRTIWLPLSAANRPTRRSQEGRLVLFSVQGSNTSKAATIPTKKKLSERESFFRFLLAISLHSTFLVSLIALLYQVLNKGVNRCPNFNFPRDSGNFLENLPVNFLPRIFPGWARYIGSSSRIGIFSVPELHFESFRFAVPRTAAELYRFEVRTRKFFKYFSSL